MPRTKLISRTLLEAEEEQDGQTTRRHSRRDGAMEVVQDAKRFKRRTYSICIYAEVALRKSSGRELMKKSFEAIVARRGVFGKIFLVWYYKGWPSSSSSA